MNKIDLKVGRFPWVTLGVAMLAVGIQLAGDAWFDLLLWRNDWLDTGEVWRVLTGHFVHASGEHLLWDLSVFTVLGCYWERRGRGAFLATLGMSVVLIDLALRWGGRFEVYCGLSAMAFGLFVGVCLTLVAEGRKGSDWMLLAVGAGGLALGLGKVGYEWMGSESLFVGELGRGFQVATETHVAGALAGGFGFFAMGILKRFCCRRDVGLGERASCKWP